MAPTCEDPAVGAAGPGECSLLSGVNAPDCSPNDNFLQSPLPSFFEMVAENGAGFLLNIRHILDALDAFAAAGDADGYSLARRKFIKAARRFAEVSRPLAEPHVLSLERIDRLVADAARLQDLALLLEGEAEQLRAIVGRAPR